MFVGKPKIIEKMSSPSKGIKSVYDLKCNYAECLHC